MRNSEIHDPPDTAGFIKWLSGAAQLFWLLWTSGY